MPDGYETTRSPVEATSTVGALIVAGTSATTTGSEDVDASESPIAFDAVTVHA